MPAYPEHLEPLPHIGVAKAHDLLAAFKRYEPDLFVRICGVADTSRLHDLFPDTGILPEDDRFDREIDWLTREYMHSFPAGARKDNIILKFAELLRNARELARDYPLLTEEFKKRCEHPIFSILEGSFEDLAVLFHNRENIRRAGLRSPGPASNELFEIANRDVDRHVIRTFRDVANYLNGEPYPAEKIMKGFVPRSIDAYQAVFYLPRRPEVTSNLLR